MSGVLYIYVLSLVDNKYYIGKTTNLQSRLNDHYSGNIRSAYWTKKYPPIGVIDLLIMANDYDEDKMVFEYMEKYGIDNVRGGSFSKVSLNPDEKKFINNILDSAMNRCFKCASNHFIKNCNLNVNLYTDDEIEEIKNINRITSRNQSKK